MATARSTLPLPTELRVLIFEFCEDYEWPEDPYDEYISIDDLRNVDEITWITATSAVRENICNTRLVCKSFLDASISSFATIFGHRRFRVNGPGLEDLQEIGAVDALAPWITTITLGTAEVSNLETFANRCDHDGSMHHAVTAIAKSMRSCSPLGYATSVSRLAGAFKAFTNLEKVHIVAYDVTDYLGGWLTPEQRQFISDHFQPGTELYQLSTEASSPCGPGITPVQFYTEDTEEKMHMILASLHTARVPLRDLRLSYAPCPQIECSFFPDTLRTLHMSAWHGCLEYEAREVDSAAWGMPMPFLRALARLKKLEDLTLIADHEDYQASLFDQQSWMRSVFEALKTASNLRRLDLQGWHISQGNLVAFVNHHASSPRRLILYETVLQNGQWLSTLHDLAQSTRNHLEYLKVSRAAIPQEHNSGRVHWEHFDFYTESEWPHFTCVTDFGLRFRLLPDSSDGRHDCLNASGKEDPYMDGLSDEELLAAIYDIGADEIGAHAEQT